MKNKKFITFLTALVFTLSAIFIILSAGSKNCYAADLQVLASWETTIDEATGQYTSIKAKWNKVWAGSGYVSMYIVALYKDGTMVAQTTVSDPVYDVSQVILKEGGKGSGTYKVEVLPVAAGMNTFITDNLVLNMHSLTISLMGQGNDIVVRNIQDRTKVAKVLKSAYISKLPANTSTQNYYIHSGKALIGFSILPWYTYDNMDELAEKSVYLFPGGDTNLTDRLVLDGDGYIYANWFNIINNVELTVTTPDCGTATNTPKKSGSWQWDQQTNAPVTAIPSGVKYSQDTSGGALSAWWVTASDSDVPYVGTLKGDESYSLQADLTAEYGYIFPYSDALGNMSITVNGATLSDYYAADEDYGHTVLSIIGNVKPKHLEQTVAGKDPSCTATGLTEGKKCSACGDILAAQNEIAALPRSGHWAPNLGPK